MDDAEVPTAIELALEDDARKFVGRHPVATGFRQDLLHRAVKGGPWWAVHIAGDDVRDALKAQANRTGDFPHCESRAMCLPH